MSDRTELWKPFSGRYVKKKPGQSGASYVEHSDITQRLLDVAGPFDQRIVQVVRGDVEAVVDSKTGEIKKPALVEAVVGVVLELTVELDGLRVTVQEVGEVEHPQNHRTDGSRLKFAVSDAIKRCAMRLGLGLHLWCGDHYYLDKRAEEAAA